MPSNYIGKNLEGMQKYFSASNIRYKVFLYINLAKKL